jgi:hypothetical protein
MIYDYPDKAAFGPAEFSWDATDSTMVFGPGPTGAIQTLDQLGERWVVSITYAAHHPEDRPEVKGFWIKLGGRAHRIRMHNLLQPVPRGTLRGAPNLKQAAVQLATTALLQNCTPGNATLLVGDLVSVLGQVLIVTEPAQAVNGEMPVSFRFPLRRSAPANTAVIWNKPSAVFMRGDGQLRMPHRLGRSNPGFSVDLIEDFS